ncbi:lipoprotein, putative [Citrifermentans bemidjiense Bem]|uniref:Lipoprotein, putative n=1 Tax=Citrifermentans bemidjiense (strain ATCC BAA-1014 / DSM 16622 / JCM 12645 / Bem) TaxID=404380 RepID=B5EEJ3_CITBB|nr:DUF1318 domain-containing protein [Citrifermentans bemidjiense]ACH40779.1 lipoprotein, putative [Citrifermentans bemidjiense Bem]
MKGRLLTSLLALACFLFSACAVITVNVYFPEKAAKEAYKSLDDMLLKPGEKPAGVNAPPAPVSPPPLEQQRPQSRLFDRVPSLSLVAQAWAADTDAEAEALAVELSSMPKVLKAYDEMSSRLPRLTTLFNSGVIGISKQGLVVAPPTAKGKLAPQDESLLAAENQSRKTVVVSMAKAILKLQKQKETKEALNLVLARAAVTFAETKREAAQPGWWTQLPNDRWVQK